MNLGKNTIGKIKIKSLAELVDDKQGFCDSTDMTPLQTAKAKIKRTGAVTTTKKLKLKTELLAIETNLSVNGSVQKNRTRSLKKEVLPGQTKIFTYFKSASKNFKIEPAPAPISCKTEIKSKSTAAKQPRKSKKRMRTGRRLFDENNDAESSSTTSSNWFVDDVKGYTNGRGKTPQKRRVLRSTKNTPNKEVETIDLCSDDEEDIKNIPATKVEVTDLSETIKKEMVVNAKTVNFDSKTIEPLDNKAEVQLNNLEKCLPMVSIPVTDNNAVHVNNTSDDRKSRNSYEASSNATTVEYVPKKNMRKKRTCPAYKVVEGTSFAVDAFQFGEIANVSHYFLTHYHADHYIGLTRKFSKPLYVSPITARLLDIFIPLEQSEYLHVIELNEKIVINDVEVTALDANHCPGAIMLLFKLTTGKCILHTGDFRASHSMESDPVFWNNEIDLLYLDTTYLSSKYDFCSQYESICTVIDVVDKFRNKNCGKRILYVCGSYVIGKEKIWSAIAEKFQLNVWAESTRYKAIKALQIPDFDLVLCEQRELADMHVIPMMKLNYNELSNYFEAFQDKYDCLLAIRPSGWEKNSKPQYRGRINIVGIEYSEHSSYKELERFVKYLKPQRVISTVPVGGGDLNKTGTVPDAWYKYNGYPTMKRKLQQNITTFMKSNPNTPAANTKTSPKRINNMEISPVKLNTRLTKEETPSVVKSTSTIYECEFFDENSSNNNDCLSNKKPKMAPPVSISDTTDDWLT